MRYIALLLLCLPLLALDNSVNIYEASGLAQPFYPLTVHRVFAQGEFPAGTYPAPRVGGTAVTYWQTDVDSTWPDGSAQRVYISFRPSIAANETLVVDFVSSANACHLGGLATCQAAALTQQQMLDYNTGGGTGSWSATWYGTMNSLQYSAAARAILTAGAWRWRLRGPIVSGIIVEDRSTALAYDFGWKYNSGTALWEAPSEAKYKSLHPMFELRFYPDPDGASPITSWSGVQVDAILMNAGSTRRQRLYPIDLLLRTGLSEGTTAYSTTSKAFHARSRRHYETWSGTAPGSLVVDYNLQYMIHTRLLPAFDYTLAVPATLADTSLSNYSTNLGSDEPQWCSNSTFCANWNKSLQAVGTRGDIGLVPYFYDHYLFLMGHSTATVAKKLEVWQKMVKGLADAAATAPIHYMETATGLQFYSTYDSTDAFGRVGSISARTNGWIAGGTSEDSYLPPVCSAAPCDGRGYNGISNGSTFGWQAYGTNYYTSHAPSFYAIPALLHGSYYYLQGAQFEASYTIATINSCTRGAASAPPYGAPYCRYNSWGILHYEDNLRENAWGNRNLAWAAILTPDSEAIEKAYFKAKLLNNIRFVEGVMLLTTGAAPPADPSCASYVRNDAASALPTFDLWCAGRDYWNNVSLGIPASNPLRLAMYGYVLASLTDGWLAPARLGTWYWNHYRAVVYGWLASSGAVLDVDGAAAAIHIKNGFATHYAGRALYSAASLTTFRDIQGPLGSTGALATDFADLAASYKTSFTLAANITSGSTSLVLTEKDTGASHRGDTYLNAAYLKIDNEYIRLSGTYTNDSPVSGQQTLGITTRGYWGSTAAAHTAGATVTLLFGSWVTQQSNGFGGYQIVARAAMASLADASDSGTYSIRRAYRTFDSWLPYKSIFTTNPMWAIVPRENVESVSVVGGTASATLSWYAPSGAACRVYVGSTAPATSSDAADVLATAPSRWQSYSALGLTAGTNYYRISCGTARASGTVTVN